MLELITFSGRLSRFGWLFNLALVGGILYGWVWPRMENLMQLNDEIDLENSLEQEILIGVLVALFILTSSAIRRLRDAGSPIPLLELFLGALIPGFGQLWLTIRLFFWGPTGQQESAPTQAGSARTASTKSDILQQKEQLTKQEAYREARADKAEKHAQRSANVLKSHEDRQARLNPDQATYDAPKQIVRRREANSTVRRTKRRLFTTGRRIGF